MLAVPVVVLQGILLEVANVLLIIAVQTQTDPKMQGRVFGTLGSLVNITAPAGVMVAGLLSDLVGPGIVLMTFGGGMRLSVWLG